MTQDSTERKRIEDAMRDAVESLQEGFALYDADDRLILVNNVYRQINSSAAAHAKQGITFEELLRINVENGLHVQAAGREEEYIQERLEQHRNPKSQITRQYSSGKWYIIKESRSPKGSIAITFTDITEQKAAEEALRESEKRFRILFEHAPEAITILDVDTGLYVDANPMAETLHGLPREELIGKIGPENLSPEIQLDGRPSSEAASDYLNQALAGQFPRFEWMHLTPDGQETLCEVSLTRLPDPHHNLVRACVINITERKQVEEALNESEERLRHIVDTSPFGVSIVSRANRKRHYVNHHFVEMLGGRSDEEILKWPAAESYSNPSKREQDWAAFERDGILISTEEQRKRLDGTTWWCLTDWRPIVFEGEEAVINWHYDITERKRVEEALRESETLLNSIFENVPVGLLIKDAQHIVERPNSTYLNWYGLDADTMVGRRSDQIEDSQPTEEVEIMNAQELEVLTTGQTQNRQVERSFADGQVHTVSITKFPVYNQENIITKVGSVSVDLTEQVRARNALTQSEEKHRQFAADVAHELRTPLAVLRTQLDNLGNEKIKQALIPDVDALTHLVGRILTMTQLDSIGVHSNKRVDLCELCTNVAANLGPLALKDGRSIEVTGAKGPLIVRGHAEALEQAVRNLVENAIRHASPASIVTIDISDDPAIKVINLGASIPPEQRETIFRRFERADRKSGGAGLGLSIVKRVVEAHDGSVDITNVPGGGAVFTIRLPHSLLDRTET